MSRRISLNLELNKRLSRASNDTPCSEKSIDSINSGYSKISSTTSNGSRLKESILKTRELIRSRISSSSLRDKSNDSQQEKKPPKPMLSPKTRELKGLDRQSLANKLNLKKYSSFLIRKMQNNEFLNSLLIDRTPNDSSLLEMIENGQTEPALLLSLQLLCDVVVHCESSFQSDRKV